MLARRAQQACSVAHPPSLRANVMSTRTAALTRPHLRPQLRSSFPKPAQCPPRASFRNTPRPLDKGHPPHAPSTSSSATSRANASARLDRLLERLPVRLQKYTHALRAAPLSHLTAFLLLHEITAVAPLLGLFALFHYGGVGAPLKWMLEHYGERVHEGVGQFERYFTRKGWFGFGETKDEETPGQHESEKGQGMENGKGDGELMSVPQRWDSADEKFKTVVEVALAWAITKVLLPARLILSIWVTPPFARLLVRGKSLLILKR